MIFTDPSTGDFVNCALDAGVVGKPAYDLAAPCGPNDDYHPWSNADRFNYAPYNLVVTPSRRVGVFGRIEHELSESASLHGRVLFNNRQSVNQAAPEPLWAGSLAESGSVLDDIVIAADNPYNPFGFDLGAGGWATRRAVGKRSARLRAGRGHALRRAWPRRHAQLPATRAPLGCQCRLVAQRRAASQTRRPQRPQDAASRRAAGDLCRHPRLRAAESARRPRRRRRHDHAGDAGVDRLRAARLQRSDAARPHLQRLWRPARLARRATGLRSGLRASSTAWAIRAGPGGGGGRHRRQCGATHRRRASFQRVVRRVGRADSRYAGSRGSGAAIPLRHVRRGRHRKSWPGVAAHAPPAVAGQLGRRASGPPASASCSAAERVWTR